MKRWIHASEDEFEFTNDQLIDLLKSHNIDTTKSKYELKAEGYERYGSGKRYTKTFTCPGDYLAYFSMMLHTTPSAKSFLEQEYTLDEIQEYLERCPSVKDIARWAEANWYGDGDDYIFSLKNLTTGETLYEGEDEPEEEYEEEDDWG